MLEPTQAIDGWNATDAPYPDACIHELFEAQAARTPGAVALLYGDDEITFDELNRRANRLARHLRQRGVGPGALAGLYIERSPDAVAALLAVLKAGGSYLPLDPAYPAARIAYMVEDAAPAVVLTRQGLAASVPPGASQLVVVDSTDAAPIAGESEENPASGAAAGDAAYVIYTSGSTGRPKGVVAPHRGAVNRFHWMWQEYPFAPGEVCCQKTALSFVDSVWEIFGPLLQGVPLAIIPDATLKDPHQLVGALAGAGVTRVVLVPSLLRLLLETCPDLRGRAPRLTFWVCSGEALPADLCRRFLDAMPGRTLLNLYGSSEVAADATCYDARAWAGVAPVPIGRPIANMRVYLLDEGLRPVPAGATGEIYVGGVGLASGYLNRPELTAERFVPDPFDPDLDGDGAAQLYKTGDLGRYRPDGAIEYRGRTDHQVKVRGHRVELGEVEAALAAHPGVRACVVVARDAGDEEGVETGDKAIVAYVAPDPAREATATASALRGYLAGQLPAYMVPSAVVVLEALPLLPNGKVDRGALPAPGAARRLDGSVVAPTTATEERLVLLWQDLLRVGPVGVTDNFFDLGAHSLLAVRLVAEIERAFGRRLPLATLFEAPTVARLAAALDARAGNEGDPTGLAPVQRGAPAGGRQPLYFVHGDFWGGGFYTLNLAGYIGADQPFYAFEQHGLHDEDVPATIEEMAADHVRTLRAHQPEGPYLLGGHCSAGLIAFEMARQLAAQGQRVDLLALVHTAVESAHVAAARRVVEPLGRLARLGDDSRMRLAERCGDYLLRLDRVARMDSAARGAAVRGKARRLLRGLVPQPAAVEPADGAGVGPSDDDPIDRALAVRRRRVNGAYIRANRRYIPGPYAGRVTLLVARDERGDYRRDRTMGWGRAIARPLDIRYIPGDHVTCVTADANVRAVARELRAAIDAATAGPG